MSAIHSGPPVLTEADIADHYSSPPRMLLFVCVGVPLAVGSLAALMLWLVKSGRM